MSAAEHKEKGNAAFKAGDYPTAIGHYTSAILADGTDPTFPLNRAAAYLKLNKNADAERDCTTVLKLQATNVKALFRRAQARVALGKLSGARTDLVAAAKAEPGNAAVRAEFTKVEELINAEAKKAKAGKGTPISLPTRPPAQPQPSGTPYRRRVPISIVNDDEDASEVPKKEDKGKAKATAAPLKGILKGTSSLSLSESSPVTTPTTDQKSNDLLRPVWTRTISPSTNAEPSIAKPPTPVPVTPNTALPSSTPTPPKPAPEPSPAPTPASVIAAPTSTGPVPEVQETEAPPIPPYPDPTPPTLLGFLQRWSNTRTDADRASILFSVPPASIPTLFGPTLESPLLGAMLSALLWALSNSTEASIPERTLSYLLALSRVPRFSTLVLFLDGAEKKCVKDVWDGLEKKGNTVEVVEIGKERKKWGC